MSNLAHNRSGAEVASLMDIASTLAELTQSVESCKRIPRFLCDALQLNAVTMAILRDPGNTTSSIALLASTGRLGFAESELSFTKALIGIHQNSRFSAAAGNASAADGETYWQNGHEKPLFELPMSDLPQYPLATAFTQRINSSHELLILVHQRAGGMQPIEAFEDLALVTQELAKQLNCQLEWQDSPQPLGYPFKQLTLREWYVLRALRSDSCEKQLAAQLGLSPHTLHTYIKSIYRKVRVQGRLPLLHRLNSAMLQMRVGMRSGKPKATTTTAQSPVAVS